MPELPELAVLARQMAVSCGVSRSQVLMSASRSV